jgi:hypothetical protein
MKFTVIYADGVWTFEVEATSPDDSYCEQFEITDLNEARDTVWNLVEEIQTRTDDPFEDFFDDNDEE